MNSPTLSLLGALSLLAPTAHAQILYDASLGTTMSAQQWTGFAMPLDDPFAVRAVDESATLDDGAYRLDTTSDLDLHAVNRLDPSFLDADRGFALSFELQVLHETHPDTHRAGYSLLMVSSDATARGASVTRLYRVESMTDEAPKLVDAGGVGQPGSAPGRYVFRRRERFPWAA